MKERFDEVDKRYQEQKAAREAAEARVEQMKQELEEASASLEQLRGERAKAEEASKEVRAKLASTRREAAAAKQHLEKVNRSRLTGSEQQINAAQVVSQTEQLTAAAERTFEEASAAVRAAEDALSKGIDECDLHSRGCAQTSDIVRAPRTMNSLVKESLKTLRKYLNAMAIHQAELECANDGLLWADKGLAEAEASLAGMGGKDREAEAEVNTWSKEQRKADDTHAKMQEKAEEEWEETAEVVSSFRSAGASFAESFEAHGKDVKVFQVRASQQTAMTAFRQVSSSFINVRRAREALAKAHAQRRKVMHKASIALAALKQAQHKTSSADVSYALQSSQEESRGTDLAAIESQAAASEGVREALDLKEAELKKQREELKTGIPLAKEAARAARGAEREAVAERQTVQNQVSKVQRSQSKMEDLMQSAVDKLTGEEYNTRQHEIALNCTKKKVGILHLPDCQEAAAAAAKTYPEACTLARSSEEKLSEAFKACQESLTIFDEEGRATGDSVVDVPVDKLADVKAAMGSLQTSLDTMAIRQCELECAQDDLSESLARLTEAGVANAVARSRCESVAKKDPVLEKNSRAAEKTMKQSEKVFRHAEQLQVQAQQAAEKAWEEMSSAVAVSLEVGTSFIESFLPNADKKPLIGQVKAAQCASQKSFRQVSSAAIAVRRSREGWVKAATQVRKTVQKESAAMVAHAEAGVTPEASQQSQ